MSASLRAKKKVSFALVLLLAFGFGWIVYRLVNAEGISLKTAPPPMPTIISRAEWGARSLKLDAPEEFGVFDAQLNLAGVWTYQGELNTFLNTIVVHHSAFQNASPAVIQDLHIDRRGFADVAYHFLIDPDGIIYEGREINIRGAHVKGFNTGLIGIVLIGDFNETEPTLAQLNSLEKLVDYLRYTYEIRYLAGHRDYPEQSPDGTECPGANLYPLLPKLARSLGMKYGIEGYITPEWVR